MNLESLLKLYSCLELDLFNGDEPISLNEDTDDKQNDLRIGSIKLFQLFYNSWRIGGYLHQLNYNGSYIQWNTAFSDPIPHFLYHVNIELGFIDILVLLVQLILAHDLLL